MKRILVLGAGYYHRRVYEKLRDGGYYLIAADQNSEAPAAGLAHEFHVVDIAAPNDIVELARLKEVDAVMPLNEFGMMSHAAAVEALGLLGNTTQSAGWAVDKELMRTRWQEGDLPQPRFVAFGGGGLIDDIAGAKSATATVGYPCVIKPADSGGSGRGIMIIRHDSEIEEAVEFARPYARNGRLLIESFIEGVEVTVEGLVVDGKHTVLAMSDKEKPALRTRVATSLNYPARFSAAILDRIVSIVDAAVFCLGLTHSATHTELIVTPEGDPILVELGARGGGGHIFSDIVEHVSGVNMPCTLAKILTGEADAVVPLHNTGACYRFFNPSSGKLLEVRGLEEAEAQKGVVDIGIFKKPGEWVGELPNSLERAGFVVTCGTDRTEAWERANLIERIVHFEVEQSAVNESSKGSV